MVGSGEAEVVHPEAADSAIADACHIRVNRMNRPVVAVRTTRHRHVAATEVHVGTVEDTCRVAWDEAAADIEEAAVAAIVGKAPTMDPVRSVEDRGAVAAAVMVAPEVPEVTAADQATTVADTTTDRLHRITRWAATRADTTKDLHRGSSLTHDNPRTRLR